MTPDTPRYVQLEDLLTRELEQRGLPTSGPPEWRLHILLRHIENNHAATISFYCLTISLLEERIEAQDERA